METRQVTDPGSPPGWMPVKVSELDYSTAGSTPCGDRRTSLRAKSSHGLRTADAATMATETSASN
jgi:hypothetical protein